MPDGRRFWCVGLDHYVEGIHAAIMATGGHHEHAEAGEGAAPHKD